MTMLSRDIAKKELIEEEIIRELMGLRSYLEKRIQELEDEAEKLKALFKIVDEVIVTKSLKKAEADEVVQNLDLFLFERGNEQFDNENYEKALSFYQRAAEINPDNFVMWYNVGAAYSKLGNHRKAAEMLKKAIKLKPEFIEAWDKIGKVYDRFVGAPSCRRCKGTKWKRRFYPNSRITVMQCASCGYIGLSMWKKPNSM